MRNTVAGTLHLVHQTLDVVEHAVDDPDQPIEVTVSSMRRQPLRQIAFYDTLRRCGHRIDAAHGIGACDCRAGQPEQSGDHTAQQERMQQHLIEAELRPLCSAQ